MEFSSYNYEESALTEFLIKLKGAQIVMVITNSLTLMEIIL